MTGSPAALGSSPRIVGLWRYPVKGMQGTPVDSLDLDELGPRFDRRWMVARPDGQMVSQRDTPLLATIEARLDGDSLHLEATGSRTVPLAIPIGAAGERRRLRIHGFAIHGHVVSAEADMWISEVLGAERHLLYLSPEDARPTDPAFAAGHRTSFTDGYPVLLASQASLEELARRAGRRIPIERFRPNLLVASPRPHDEDRWRRFAVGGLVFRGVKLCSRCSVTTVDQQRGALDADQEPLRSLSLYRRIESLVYFGVYVVHEGRGRIAVGDDIEVLERGVVPGAAKPTKASASNDHTPISSSHTTISTRRTEA